MKKIVSIMFAMVIGISLAIGGGVLLSSYGGEKYSDKSNISVGEGDGNQNVQIDATLPQRKDYYFNGNGGTVHQVRENQISDISLTNYGNGFEVNAKGYLESQNKGVNNSYAMLKIRFNARVSNSSFTIRYISSGETSWDFALFSNLDVGLLESNVIDNSEKVYKSTKSESSTDEKSVTYSNISSGTHYIWIKFRKDGSVNQGNDSLQLFFESDIWDDRQPALKYHYKGMQYGTLPTATKPGYEFKGWYTNLDNNMMPPLSTWTLSGGATYDSSTGAIYIPNTNSSTMSPLIYVGDTDINSTFTWYFSAEFMCPTAATSSSGNMFFGGVNYYNASKVRYSGNGWADSATPGVWRSITVRYDNIQEWLGKEFCQWLSLDFTRSAEWANEPYYIRNVRFWLVEDKGRKVESHHTIESFSTLYAHWEPIKYTVSFDAPNLFEDADYVMYRCEGDVTQWVNENGQQRTTVKFTEWTESYSCGIYFYADKLIAGEKYIWRAEVKSTLSHIMSIGYEMGGYTSVNVSTEWQIFEKEFTATDTGGVPAFSFYYGFSVGEVLDIAGMTVQKKSDVSFDKAVESLKKPYENTYGYLPTPTRANYTFSGWKNTHNYFINPSTKITYDKATTWKDGWHFCNLKDLGIYLTSGKAYRFSFDMKLISGTNQPWNSPTLFINGNTSGMLTNEDGSTALKNVTNSWQRYTGTFTYQADTTSNSYRHDTVHIYPRYNDDASLQGQITNLEIVEENIITSSTKMSVIGNHVLKAEWTPIAVTHNVKLMTISMNGNDVSESGLGGSVVVYRYSINGSTSSSGTYYQAESSASYTVHKGHTFELVANNNSGYAFVGFSTSSTPSEAIKNPSGPPSTTLTNYPTTNTNYYVYFKKVSDNRLKYDEADKYFYFEDGNYPQSEATNSSTLNASATATGESIKYAIAGSEEKEYTGNNYDILGREYMYEDRITVSLWAYMDDWKQYRVKDMRMISCTEAGGWNIQPNIDGKIDFAMYDKGYDYVVATSSETFYSMASGWHLFTMTFDGECVRGYLDGKLVATSAKFKSGKLGYCPSNVIFVGAEAMGNATTPAEGYGHFEGKIKGLEIINRAMSANEIYVKGGCSGEIPIYTYNNESYAKVTARGQTKWFKFEPIRWRISDYGIEYTEKNISRYTMLYNLRNYTSFATNFNVVSDLILGVGAMNNTRIVHEGDTVEDMQGFASVRNIANDISNDTLKFDYSKAGNIINIDSYSDYGGGKANAVNKNNTIAYSEPIRLCSLEELNQVGFVNKQARASDMVTFILGQDKNNVSYWTRDLSNLGSGIAITPSGTKVRPWLDEVLGIRFSYTFREASNAGGGRIVDIYGQHEDVYAHLQNCQDLSFDRQLNTYTLTTLKNNGDPYYVVANHYVELEAGAKYLITANVQTANGEDAVIALHFGTGPWDDKGQVRLQGENALAYLTVSESGRYYLDFEAEGSYGHTAGAIIKVKDLCFYKL